MAAQGAQNFENGLIHPFSNPVGPVGVRGAYGFIPPAHFRNQIHDGVIEMSAPV